MTAELITPAQAATRKGVSTRAIYKAIKSGRLPAQRLLGRLALRPADVEACPFEPHGNAARFGGRIGPQKGEKGRRGEKGGKK